MRQRWRPVLDRIVPYQAGKPIERLEEELGRQLVRLSANENPLGPSPNVVRAVAREAERVHLYPDAGSTALRVKLAAKLGVTADQVIVGNGADELLALVAVAALEPGREVVVPHPSFEPYTTVVAIAGADASLSPLSGYDTDVEDVRRRVTPRTTAIVLCSPHNPTGTIVRRDALLRLLDALGDDPPLVVLDEAYGDFADDPEYPDGVRLLDRYPNLLVLRTFSKIAGLAGLRVGYAVGSVVSIDHLNRVRSPYNVNRVAQVAALAALEDDEHWTRTRDVVLAERAWLSTELSRRGYTSPRSHANFLLVRVADAAGVTARLARAGILVRDGAAVGFPQHLRISVGLRETNERLLAVLDGTAP